MKKILLLSISSFTMLMADFTLIGEQLTPVNQPVGETTPTVVESTTGTSKYLEPITLPECNSNNPEVQFIRSNADWSTINSSSKRIFCVSPGDYTSLRDIILTASGTAEKRRYIILNNGNDLHPGKLNKSQLANFSLSFKGASYWTLDRPAYFDRGATNAYEFSLGSTNNIMNRMFTNNIGRSVRIIDNSHNNTIQNSRLDTMNHGSRTSDMTAIELVPYPVGGKYELTGTKIINNEIKNANDGFQMVSYWYESGTVLNGEGTIIDSNDIYITNEIYTNGKGNYTTSGTSAYAENAIDLKFASANANNPVVVTNNHFWGYRASDRTNSSLNDPGSAISAHYGITNLVINDNYIFDSNGGINMTATGGFSFTVDSSEIKRNVIKDCGTVPGSLYGNYTIYIYKGAMDIENNLLFNSRIAFSNYLSNLAEMNVNSNLVMDSPTDWLLSSNNASGVFEYNTANDNGGNYLEVSAASQGYTDNYTFTTDKFTNSPRIITLTNTVKP